MHDRHRRPTNLHEAVFSVAFVQSQFYRGLQTLENVVLIRPDTLRGTLRRRVRFAEGFRLVQATLALLQSSYRLATLIRRKKILAAVIVSLRNNRLLYYNEIILLIISKELYKA